MEHKCYSVCDEEKVRNLVNSRDPNLAEKFDLRLSGVQVLPIVEMPFVLAMILKKYLKLNVHVVNNFALIAYLKHTHLVHVQSGKCGFIQSPAQTVTNQLKRMEVAIIWHCGDPLNKEHKCGRYVEKSEKKEEFGLITQNYLLRYTHYLNRYKAHLDSLKLESKLKKTGEEKILCLIESDAIVTNYSWVSNGIDRLFRSRRILSYSYAFAYYMFGDEPFENCITNKEERKRKQNLFEDQQQQLELNVEKLSSMIEDPFEYFPQDEISLRKAHIINLTRVVDKLCKELYECIENDFMDSSECANSNIALYKSNGVEKASKLVIHEDMQPSPSNGEVNKRPCKSSSSNESYTAEVKIEAEESSLKRLKLVEVGLLRVIFTFLTAYLLHLSPILLHLLHCLLSNLTIAISATFMLTLIMDIKRLSKRLEMRWEKVRMRLPYLSSVSCFELRMIGFTIGRQSHNMSGSSSNMRKRSSFSSVSSNLPSTIISPSVVTLKDIVTVDKSVASRSVTNQSKEQSITCGKVGIKMSPPPYVEDIMKKQLTPLNKITNGPRRWTTRVVVSEKFTERRSQHTSNRYQHMVLSDSEGNSVQATLYEDSIDLFRDKLKLHRTYYISNAYVKHAPKSHTLTNNAFQWTINSSTLIEEAKETEAVITIPQRSLVSFSELQNYVKTNTEIDLLGIVVAIKDPRDIQTIHGPTKLQEITIVNTECEVNKEFLLQQSSKTDDSSSSSATPPPPGDFKDLSTITSTTNKSDHYWVKASIALTNFQQRFAYIACNKCNISTGAELEETFDCIKGHEGKGVGRSCVQVHLKDNTTALPATLFGSIANKFLNCSTAQLLQQITENGNEDIKNIINPCSEKQYNIKLKPSTKEYAGEMKCKYIVDALHDVESG
ncbi:hypothetical protein F8388_005102 [Cannabis sativa]|uniref:Uncharacterized protein n=1 Tax=Cannabis sativa TaxID=3483 RepID=A0A7J6E0D5_CANSA|nr:hypothetical protein F8388_005102 [Cannabis sativa]